MPIGPALIVPERLSPSTVSDQEAVIERPPMLRVVSKRSRSPLIRPSSIVVVARPVISPVTLPSSLISSSAVRSWVPRGVVMVIAQVPDTSCDGASVGSSDSRSA